MTEMVPSRAAGRAAMQAFIPAMGHRYENGRNYDYGPGRHKAVSMLSPYIRRRLITEAEVVTAALDAHGPEGAGKFIEEVIWRGYYKGWLERRPQVWDSYVKGLNTDLFSLERDRHLRRDIALAETGQTGLDCFDAWAHELVETGYLHNHARMWFASIWILTLGLPWRLGADFFFRHLLDGDAASNTLGWRGQRGYIPVASPTPHVRRTLRHLPMVVSPQDMATLRRLSRDWMHQSQMASRRCCPCAKCARHCPTCQPCF